MQGFDDAFAWTFPLYVLGMRPKVDPHGEMSITKETSLISAEGPDGRALLAMFTDVDLAERFRQCCCPDTEVWKYPFSATDALQFLRSAPPGAPGVLIDPNPKTRIGRVMSIAETIQEIEAHLADN